jgi:hypothetical protein
VVVCAPGQVDNHCASNVPEGAESGEAVHISTSRIP